jgi:hypothetical protein
MPPHAVVRVAELTDSHGNLVRAAVMKRGELMWAGPSPGPMLLIDSEATTFVPDGWIVRTKGNGSVIAERLLPSALVVEG